VSAGLVVADFNGDGKPDIVATFLGDACNAPNVTVLLNETAPYGAQTGTKRKSNGTSRK
jgi:FG-GAP repeat